MDGWMIRMNNNQHSVYSAVCHRARSHSQFTWWIQHGARGPPTFGASQWIRAIQTHLHVYCIPCPEKRGDSFFLHNFNKCRHSSVIFGKNHPEDSFLLRKEEIYS